MTAKLSSLPLHRILLAEDDATVRGFLERALGKAGYEVSAFANGPRPSSVSSGRRSPCC